MKKLLLGSFLSAIALFVWGFIYFGVSGIPYSFLVQSTDGQALALKDALPSDGAYILPHPGSENMQELMQRGPVATVHIKRGGFENHMGMMVSGFIHGWIYCLLLGLLLKQICKKTDFGGRVGFVVLVSVTGAFMARFGDAIWWHQSWGWQFSNMLYTALAGVIVGLILAKFIPRQTN